MREITEGTKKQRDMARREQDTLRVMALANKVLDGIMAEGMDEQPQKKPAYHVIVQPERKGPTNADYARTSSEFMAACEQAKCQPTKRQASKFRRKMGIAYKARNNSAFYVEK